MPEHVPVYRRTLFDRLGPDAGARLRAAGWGAGVACLTAMLVAAASALDHASARTVVARAALAGVAGGLGVTLIAGALSRAAGAAFRAFMQPSGASCPAEPQYSLQEAMVARGDVAGALAAYDMLLHAHPERVALRLRIADLCARSGHDYHRARVLYQDVQRRSGVTAGDHVYATQRLIDLYLGPLGTPAKALPELRRLADTYPNTPVGTGARDGLRRIKAEVMAHREWSGHGCV